MLNAASSELPEVSGAGPSELPEVSGAEPSELPEVSGAGPSELPGSRDGLRCMFTCPPRQGSAL